MPVGVMLRSMSSMEFIEWIAFSRIEPFGGEVEDYRAGIGAAVTVHMNRSDSSEPMMRPLDLFPWTEHETAAPETPEQIEAKVRDFALRQEKMRRR